MRTRQAKCRNSKAELVGQLRLRQIVALADARDACWMPSALQHSLRGKTSWHL